MIVLMISEVPPKIYANLFSRVEFEDATRGPGSQLLDDMHRAGLGGGAGRPPQLRSASGLTA